MINAHPTAETVEDLETMAQALERSGGYRVLRRLEPLTRREPPTGVQLRQGLFVDTETTGLDAARDEIIELAMVPFTYGVDGEIYGIGEAFQQLRQPSKPIPPEVTAITGIDDAMVEGHAIDTQAVAAFAAPAALVIAHNAAFDRKFLERYSDVFNTKPWACSMSEVDWAGEGYEGVKLAYLASSAGFFYERHRATHDCLAALELLARVHPVSRRTGLAQLLDRARAPSWRIWAENAPFDFKDQLKARGYRWNAEAGGGPRAWYIDVAEAVREPELAFLKAEIYRGEIDLLTRRVDAYDRFSDRC
ncbi:3'-5' exonuclease [Caulobacter sp. S45]|uniref:3'-5' exonuclease n=1 Tax=Caulobacter sp. S45 TaxID=1641861 RepID=UPI00210FC3D8|nr:3'-5' exonuclease [Caulobacter sp. S45]